MDVEPIALEETPNVEVRATQRVVTKHAPEPPSRELLCVAHIGRCEIRFAEHLYGSLDIIVRRFPKPDRLSAAHKHYFIGNDRGRHLQKIDAAGARRSLPDIHDVAIDGERHDEIGVELVEGTLDRLRHTANHPEREPAVD